MTPYQMMKRPERAYALLDEIENFIERGLIGNRDTFPSSALECEYYEDIQGMLRRAAYNLNARIDIAKADARKDLTL